MPSYVILQSSGRIGETIDATLCDPNAITGYPNRTSDTPVRVRLPRSGERLPYVDDQPRAIISCIGKEPGLATEGLGCLFN